MVDFQTGFRRYHLAQVPMARRIRLLRSFDTALAEIRAVPAAPDAATERPLLARQRRRMEQHLTTYQRAPEALRAVEDGCERTREEQSVEHEAKAHCCSFCGKANHTVQRIIAGPNGVFIRSACVTLRNDLIVKKEKEQPAAAS